MLYTYIKYPVTNSEPTGLTLNRTLISQLLKRLGYKTHIVGKWHLGHCNKAYLPLSRGFDTHYGYWEGAEDYYTKVCYNRLPVSEQFYKNILLSQINKLH